MTFTWTSHKMWFMISWSATPCILTMYVNHTCVALRAAAVGMSFGGAAYAARRRGSSRTATGGGVLFAVATYTARLYSASSVSFTTAASPASRMAFKKAPIGSSFTAFQCCSRSRGNMDMLVFVSKPSAVPICCRSSGVVTVTSALA